MKELYQLALDLEGAVSGDANNPVITIYNYASRESNIKRYPLLIKQAKEQVLKYELEEITSRQGKIQLMFKEIK